MTKDYRKNSAFQTKKQTNKMGVLNAVLIFLLGYLSANLFDLQTINNFLKKPDVINRSQLQKKSSVNRPKFEFYTLLADDYENKTQTHQEVSNLNATPNKKTKIPQPDFKPIEASIAKRLMAHSNLNTQQNVAIDEKQNPVINKTHNYMVQMGAFKNQNDAQNLKASLILKGFNTSIAVTSQPNMRLYRVLVGPFNSKEQAQSMQKALAVSQRINGILINASLL